MLLQWSFIFLIVAIIAGVFGFGGIAQESAWIAKVLFLVFLVLFVFSYFFFGTPAPTAVVVAP